MNQVAHVTLGLPVEGHFDYLIPPALRSQIKIGQRVRISFINQNRIGYVIGFAEKSVFKKLKPVFSILELNPILDAKALALSRKIAEHYGCSWGEAIETILPKRLRQVKTVEIPEIDILSFPPPLSFPRPPKVDPPLAEKRESNEGKLQRESSRDDKIYLEPILIHDQTLTKRWPVILEHIQNNLAQGKQVIFLIPQVSLIEKVVSKLKEQGIDEIVILDKKLTTQQEFKNWLKIKTKEAKVIVGTRSAIFAPTPALGLLLFYFL